MLKLLWEHAILADLVTLKAPYGLAVAVLEVKIDAVGNVGRARP
jgi:hypothetical protein